MEVKNTYTDVYVVTDDAGHKVPCFNLNRVNKHNKVKEEFYYYKGYIIGLIVKDDGQVALTSISRKLVGCGTSASTIEYHLKHAIQIIEEKEKEQAELTEANTARIQKLFERELLPLIVQVMNNKGSEE